MGAGAVICGTKPQPSVVNILIISYSTFLIETFNFNCNYYRIFERFLFETKLQKKTKNLFHGFLDPLFWTKVVDQPVMPQYTAQVFLSSQSPGLLLLFF